MAKRAAWEWYKEIANVFTGPMTVSSFQKTGKLTPEEFVLAGDALVQKCPVWEWASGDKAVQPFLPQDKKFLVLRQAPCKERATSLLQEEGGEKDAEDDWVSTHTGHVVKKAAEVAQETEEQGGWDDPEVDDAKIAAPKDSAERVYELTVVYDQFHATPRMYLCGYSAGSKPLTAAEMMEDVYSENRGKTVTVDPHPFLKAACISIHPCRHAETMQRILQRMSDRIADQQEEAGIPEKERIPFVFPPYLALFVFLKFISSVVPTISYDIMMDIEM